MKLLERTREGTRPTDAGRVLVDHADAAIARLDEAERELAAIAGLEGGEVRIASFPSASATLLTMAVSDFVERHPKVRLSVTEAEPEESMPRLRAGDIDLALTFDYPGGPGGGRARHRAHAAAHRVDARRAAAEPPAGRPAEGADGRPLRRRLALGRLPSSRAARWSSAPAATPASTRGSGSSRTTTTCSRASWRPASASRSCPTSRCRRCARDIVVLPTDPPAPVRRVWAETRRTRSAATDAMLGVLVEAGERFAKQHARLEVVA